MTAGRKPPHNVQVLQRWVGDLARQDGIAPARLQRWISFMVVAGLLEHARDNNLDPLFVLKGGAAMELRLGLRARATKGFDATFRHAVLNMVEHLDEALRRGHGDFTATRSELEPIAETGAQRVDIKLAYRGHSWATVQLEIAVAEGQAGREIDRLPGKPKRIVTVQQFEKILTGIPARCRMLVLMAIETGMRWGASARRCCRTRRLSPARVNPGGFRNFRN